MTNFGNTNDWRKKAARSPLAPIVVKILVDWGSVHKITTKSGRILAENASIFLLQKINN